MKHKAWSQSRSNNNKQLEIKGRKRRDVAILRYVIILIVTKTILVQLIDGDAESEPEN